MLVRALVVRHPLGSSEQRRNNALKAVVGIWGLAVIGSFAVAVLLPRHRMTHCYETKFDIARLAVREYADSAYPMWAKDHPGATCPRSLGELNEYTNRKGLDISDPWGRDLIMLCGDRSVSGPISVFSLGADARPNTDDDIRSWE